MSNAELVREYFQVWNEEGLGGLVFRYEDFFTDDFEWRPPVTEITGARYIGRDGFEQYVADVQESLGDVRAELQKVTEIAPDAVRVRARVHGEGTSSGAAIDAIAIGVIRFRDGRECWGWASYDHATAERVAEAIARGEEAPL
ncbi:MAG: nuclear transport factor 2 family protein [Actinomycetota bacterium]